MAKKVKKAKKPKKLKKAVKIVKKTKPASAGKDVFSDVKKTKIKVIGIGGGGSSIIAEIAPKLKKASFVAANTDLKGLRSVGQKVAKFQFGQSLTHGLGTGMNFELAEQAAMEEKEKIKKLLSGADLCILVSSFGGGAGSGAAPVFAKISKELGNITYGIFTLPFKFEGEKKTEIAQNALEKVRPHLNAFSVIPNDRIFQVIEKDTPLREALSQINKDLAQSLEGLIETIYEPGLINIDFADLRTILEGRGRLAYLNTVESQGSNRLEDSLKKLLSSPLYPYTIQGARGILFNIAGEKGLSLEEINQISKTISQSVNKDAKIIFGLAQGSKYKNKIKVSLLATGCGAKVFSKKPPRKPKKKAVPEPKPEPEPEKQEITKEIPEPRPPKTAKKVKTKPKKAVSAKVKKPEKKKPGQDTAQKSLKIKVSEDQAKQEEVDKKAQNRKNALQIKEEAEEEEQELLAKEKAWETPAFLRRHQGRSS